MKYPFFASFIVLCLTLMYTIHRTREKEAKRYNDFWDEETRANNTRRKSLDDLKYITIPFDDLPMDILSEDSVIAEYHRTLHDLSAEPIVNFTGFSNTELKLQYGAPNIDILMRYDEAYTILARTLSQWASYLYDKEYTSEARVISEYALSTGTDVSATYELLIKIYKDLNCPEKIEELLPYASEVKSLLKSSILEKINNAIKENLPENITAEDNSLEDSKKQA